MGGGEKDSGEAPDRPPPGSLKLNPQPQPRDVTDLQLVQIVAVFAVLHHPSEHQQPRPIAHKAIGGATGGDVASDGRDEPLVGGCGGGGGGTES